MSGSIYVGTKAGTLQAPPAFDEYSGVILVVSDEVEYTAGKTTGRVLEVSCPWGTQKVADRILARIRGYQYQPFTAAGVDLNPAAQLGDGVTIENTYGGLYSIETQYGAVSSSDIAAPGEEELDHEFAYEPKSQREVRRKFKNVESQLSIQAGQISGKVSAEGGSEDGSFGWVHTNKKWEFLADGVPFARFSKGKFWMNGDGEFTGEVHAGNIKAGGSAGYVGRNVLASGIRTSLDWADTAGDVFQGNAEAEHLWAKRLKITGSVELWNYRVGIKHVNVNGESLDILCVFPKYE